MNNMQDIDVLKSALEQVKIVLKDSSTSFAFWQDFINTLNFVGIENENIVLQTKNAFAKQVLQNEYQTLFMKEFSKILNTNVGVNFIIPGSQTKKIFENPIQQPKASGMNKNYLFDNFVVGAFNKMAFNATQSLFSSKYWNPIFIHGGCGLGKTHLLHAIGNKFVQLHPNKKAKYITSDEFIRETYSCLSGESKNIEQLKEEYEECDLLLLDDVQFLANKEKINEIFFHIFNSNISQNKIIVLSSDRPPNELSNFNERIKSRFSSGLLVKITKPDLVSVKTILEKKIEEINENYKFTNDAMEYIVRRNDNDIRQLEGFLHQILFFVSNSLPTGSIISLQVIKEMSDLIHNYNYKSNGFDFDPQIVIKQICEIYKISEDQIKSKIRTKQISLIRQVCMYVLKEKFPNISLQQIGYFFGGRDHSTVIESIEKVKKIIKKDISFGNFIENIIKKI